MKDGFWRQALAWIMVLFFVVGALGNIFAPTSIEDEYRRWGYPTWFHFVTGTVELTAAALLSSPRNRLLGVAVGSVVMLAAAATVLLHRQYAHAIPPFVVLALLVLVGVTGRRMNRERG